MLHIDFFFYKNKRPAGQIKKITVMIKMLSLLLIFLTSVRCSKIFTGQKYAVRQLYGDSSCSGSAGVAQALELNKCFPNVDASVISLSYAVEGDNFITTTWMHDNTCTKKPAGQQSVSISQQCQVVPNMNLHLLNNNPFASVSDTSESDTSAQFTQYASFVFTNSIPDATIGYPYLQTNYTASDVCNTSLFNVPILFHQDATDTCLPAATLSYAHARSIKLTKGLDISTAFAVEYYETDNCGAMLGKFNCPSHCIDIDHGKIVIPTAVACLTSTTVVAGGHGFVFIAIVCLICALVLGYGVFVCMRKRAEFDPDSVYTPVGSKWVDQSSNNSSAEGNSYSTFS